MEAHSDTRNEVARVERGTKQEMQASQSLRKRARARSTTATTVQLSRHLAKCKVSESVSRVRSTLERAALIDADPPEGVRRSGRAVIANAGNGDSLLE